MTGQLSAEWRIKRHILREAAEHNDDLGFTVAEVDAAVDQGAIANLYDKLVEVDAHWDFENEFRCSGEETELAAPFSRHYESESVARQLSDGTWVGWTYWHGGGKHGNEEEIEWMSEAYDLTVAEEQKMVTVRTFARAE